MIPQLAMASQQTSGFATRVATGVPAGGTVLPDLKALDQHIGDTRTAELNPTTRVVAQMQGTSREFIAISAYEGCTDVITGANIGVQTPLMTSVMQDDYGRPVAGAPAQGQDLYGTQSTPGNLIATGTKNTGKVAFLSGLFAGDGAAVDPYGTFNFTDPVTGKSYSARTKADSVQQQPRVRAVIGDGLVFGPSAGQTNVGKPITVNLADKMGLQFLDDGNGGKAVATLADLTSIGYDETGALTSLLGKGGNGSEHFKAGDAIWFLPGPPPTTAPTLTLHAGSGLVADTIYDYAYAVTTAKGDTGLSPIASITPSGSTRSVQIDVASLPAGTVGTGIRVVRRVSARAGSPAGAWKTVQALTGPLTAPFSLVDSTPSTALGADYTESPTTINVKLYAQQNQPFGASVALPGTTPPLFPLNGLMIGDTTSAGGNNNGLALDLAAYTTPVRTGLLAPIISDTVTPLLNGAGTKKLVSGLKIGGGDDHNGEQIDIAVNAAGKPLGVKIGQGVDGNGLAAFPDLATIDYRVIDGALEAIGLNNPPPPPPVTTPPGPSTNPPGTVCTPPVTAPDGTIYQDCTTTVTNPPPPGTGTGDQQAPPTTVPAPTGGGTPSAGAPGFRCDGTPTIQLPLGTLIDGFETTSPNLIGPDGFTFYGGGTWGSTGGDQNEITMVMHLDNHGNWLQGHFHSYTDPQYGHAVGFQDGTADQIHMGDLFGLYRPNGTSDWFLFYSGTVQGVSPYQPGGTDCWWALYLDCAGIAHLYLGTSETEYTEVYEGAGDISAASLSYMWRAFGNAPPSTKISDFDHLTAYNGIPAGVTIHNINGTGTTYTGTGTTATNLYPGDTSGLTPITTSTTTTTATPPSTVTGNLSVDGGIYVQGNPMTGIITAVDINAPFALVPDSFMKITDPFTGVDYISPVSMYPNGAPGAMSGGYFWPGA